MIGQTIIIQLVSTNMARKIFVSYKYADSNVQNLNNLENSTPRSYVDLMESELLADEIYKGESDGDDLSHLSEETIEDRLRERMFDSSMTIVLISKNMKEAKSESLQWIPREVAYSLRVKSRGEKTSGENAMIALILPDSMGSYSYIVDFILCHETSVRNWKTETMFSIIGQNMFNLKEPNKQTCSGILCQNQYHAGNDHSYIYPVLWQHFKMNSTLHINQAYKIKENIDQYKLVKTL